MISKLGRTLAIVFLSVKAASASTATAAVSQHAPADPSIDWDAFGFSLNGVRTDKMWVSRITDGHQDDYSKQDCLVPLGPLQLHPASTVLNYGQGLFEGLKAFRRADDSIALFRPDMNGQRMKKGAERFLMPSVPIETFCKAADEVVKSNAKWVPPHGKGALYLRPLLFGSGEDLGVKPSPECTFCIYASPVGNYFKGDLQAIRLQAVKGYSRAGQGGSGGVKAIGNYAPAFLVQKEVRSRGYDEALFLDAKDSECIEEAGASNFWAVFPNNTIVTPALSSDTILPGVTRMSIMELAREEFGCTVIEGRLTLDDLDEAVEAFCCGTGASITPVGSVSCVTKQQPDKEVRPSIVFGDGKKPGPLTEKLYKTLLDIQMGTDEQLGKKYEHWIHLVKPDDKQ